MSLFASRKNSFALLVAAGVAVHLGNASQAEACGGCFHPPEGLVSSVNAHRMAFSMSPRGSTLWDQIVYTGAPEDFVWVLPIAGDAQVEVADNGFFEALTQGTQIVMEAPPAPRAFCSDPCPSASFAASSGRATSESDFNGGVTVLHEGVVGPYETATIGSEDPRALVNWLTSHGYGVDSSILPTVDYYVRQNMNFAVLRLSPGAGVDRMQPVRVTVPGLATSLPLRMVQAGVITEVDLELFVFAESRIEASNFGNAVVDHGLVTFNWNDRSFDYEAAFDAALFAGEGPRTNWVTEYAQPIGPSGNPARAGFGGTQEARVGWSFLANYASIGSDRVTHRAAEDANVVRAAFGESDVYLTRLRTRLQRSQLQEDLVLRMSGGGDIGTHILVTNELNRAPDIACSDFCAAGNGIDPGGSTVRGGGGAFRRCSASNGRGGETMGAFLGLAVGAILIARRRAR